METQSENITIFENIPMKCVLPAVNLHGLQNYLIFVFNFVFILIYNLVNSCNTLRYNFIFCTLVILSVFEF